MMLAPRAGTQDSPVELDAQRKPTLVTNGNCFIRGGTLLTVTQDVIPNGDLLIQNGKIAALGKNLPPPPGIPVIDATGKFITPGIVDAHSHISEEDNNEFTDSITAEVRIQDVLDPDALSIYRGLSNGVTASLILHGSANPIGGQSVVIKMKWKRPVEELPVPDAPRIIKFALGENVKQTQRFPGQSARYPATRLGVETVYRRAFIAAQEYKKAWARYEQERQSNPNAVPPRRDLRLETLADILDRKIWVHCHCYRADEMLMMLRLSQEFGFKIGALQHALEAYKIAPEIAAAGVSVSVFADLWSYKIEAYDAIPYDAAFCVRAGILTSVNSDNDSGTYRLNLEAANCIKYGGLNETEALKLITINPAIQLGIGHRTGSLEVGKDADIAIWEGHPLSVYSKCVMTLVEGDVFYQRRDLFGLDRQAVVKSECTVCPADHLHLPVPPDRRVYAIVGATVHPITAPDIPEGTVVIEDGRITAVGKNIPVPKGAAVVHAHGMHVYPGLVDAGSVLGLTEIEQIPATVDLGEGGTFQPDLLALTAVNPASEHLAVTRCNGVTTALTHPAGSFGDFFGGGGAIILGQSGVIHLAGWTPNEMKVESPSALHIQFPEGASGAFSAFLPPDALQRSKDEEKGQIRKLRDYFDRAKHYQAVRAQNPDQMAADPRLEAMVPYITGKLPVILHVDSAHGIRNAIQFAEDYRLKAILAGAKDAWRMTDTLAKKHIPVLCSLPMTNSADDSSPMHDYDPTETTWATPALLQRAGVKFCFQSGNAPEAKNLPRQVGITCAYGLPHDAALRALTIQAAEILGLDSQIGSLTAGKQADVIVTDGDPLEVTTSVHTLFIAGKPVPLENRHTRLYLQYQKRLAPGAASAATLRGVGSSHE